MSSITVILAIIAVLTAILFPHVSTTIDYFGVLKEIKHINDPTCQLISPELFGCEDAQVHESGLVFLACAKNLEERRAWWPPIDNFDTSVESHSALTVFNLTSNESFELELKGFKSEFSAHGLGILTNPSDPNQVLIAALNHKRSGSVVERFTYQLGSKHVDHVKTVKNSELLYHPNDVVVTGVDTFYATNDLAYTGVLKELEVFTRRPYGHVVFYDGEKMRIVARNIAYANGISSSTDLSKIYVASACNQQVTVYERKDNDGLRLLDVIQLNAMADNLSVDIHTGDIYTLGVQNGLIAKKASHDASVVCPSVGTKITINTDKDQFYGKKFKPEQLFYDNGEIVNFGSVFISDSKFNKSFFSGLFTKGIYLCDHSF
ncbi:hypothetical protein BC833DRAFT_448859 [Globomyces pollinis-pini]|nr:hypothetical protein BC833DRAFT_448859 [Globomyces pollinis-pini]